MFRLWAFAASAPLGLGIALAWPAPLSVGACAALATATGALGAGLATLAARLGAALPDRAAHVTRGASFGLAALPGVAAVVLHLGPPPWLWLALAALAFALGLWRASRSTGPGPGIAGQLAGAAAVLLLALALGGALVVAYGSLAPRSPDPDAELRHATLDIDSRVPLRAPSPCAARVAALTTLVDFGARPRLGADGETLWFEARAADGRYQVHRLAPGAGPTCWTCAEPGNNRRPAPHPTGKAVLFDTDRFASWRSPAETEVMVVSGHGVSAPRQPARRLTYTPGPDDHASYDPSGSGLVWTHGGAGRFEVRRAAILSGHGGLMLSTPIVLFRGRSSWTVLLGWAPDARTLAAGFGQPLAPLAGERVDPVSGERRRIEGGLVAGSLSFSADGRRLAIAETRGRGAARLVPRALGNALARLAADEPSAEGTRVRIGDVDGRLEEVALGAAASFGAPTGIALLPDASGFVLGQRGGAGERIVRVTLDCPR